MSLDNSAEYGKSVIDEEELAGIKLDVVWGSHSVSRKYKMLILVFNEPYQPRSSVVFKRIRDYHSAHLSTLFHDAIPQVLSTFSTVL